MNKFVLKKILKNSIKQLALKPIDVQVAELNRLPFNKDGNDFRELYIGLMYAIGDKNVAIALNDRLCLGLDLENLEKKYDT